MTFTTAAFDRSSSWRFEAFPYRTAPKGPPSSLVQHGGSRTFLTQAESARGVSPRAAHRSGRDTPASSGSCHRTKTAAFRREMRALPVVSWPALNVGDLPPLLHGHYPASWLLQSSPPLPAASVLS